MESKSEPDKVIYSPLNTSTVCIRCISKDATYDEVRNLFAQAGYLLHFSFRNNTERYSSGFASATYRFESEAMNAVELFDYRVLHDKILRVTFIEAEDRARKTNTNGCPTVSFKNANMVVREDQLRDQFEKIGEVVEFKILEYYDSRLEDAGKMANGFVTFVEEKFAKLAIEKLNNLVIGGLCMDVDPYISEIDRKAKEEEEKIEKLRRTVVVKNFSSESSILHFCQKKVGGVLDLNTKSNEAENSSECRITFLEIGQAVSALQEMKEDGEKPWLVGWALTRSELDEIMKKYDVEQNCHIVVKNLDESVKHMHLREMFSPFGEVLSWKVDLDSQGNSTGTGYVRFAYSKDATRAVKGMNGKVIGKKNCLIVAFDESNADKRQKVQVG